MLRRGFLSLLALWPAAGAISREILDVFSSLATALSGGDAIDFMSSFDRSMAGYDRIRENVTALIEQNSILTSIEVLSEETKGTESKVEVDWLLEIRSRELTGPLVRRDEKVNCRLAKRGRHWKIVELKPQTLFELPHSGMGRG